MLSIGDVLKTDWWTVITVNGSQMWECISNRTIFTFDASCDKLAREYVGLAWTLKQMSRFVISDYMALVSFYKMSEMLDSEVDSQYFSVKSTVSDLTG